jgi:hypothetical protein
MHASIQATLYNAHFQTDGLPWTAEDLLGKGDRQKRKSQQVADRMTSFRIQQAVMTPDEGNIPEWARELSFNKKKVN